MMRWLILLHRYLGIAIGWLVVLWCLSGVVMMYVGYPEVTTAERARLLPPLDLERCCAFDPLFGGIGVDGAHVEMLGDEPVMRVTDDLGRVWTLGLADGRFIDAPDHAAIESAAAALAASLPDAEPRYLGTVERDQWTVTAAFDRHRPLHLFALGDPAGTLWYFSSTTGELVQASTRAERFWNWLGSVPHWLYPTLLRQNGPLWVDVVIATSLVGLFLTAIGVYIGIARLKRRRSGRWSPYRGLALWHHWLGLAFGVLTLTWLGSGLLSVNPWGLLEPTGARAERENLRGAVLDVDDLRRLSAALARREPPPGTVRLELAPFAGRIGVLAYDAEGRTTRLDAETLAPAPLDAAELERAARSLVPGTAIASAALVSTEDAYYFSHHSERPLPVYRVILADDAATRYYIDPASGRLLLKVDGAQRGYRWLFEGLHRFDFTATMRARPLWDVLMILLLAGVTGVSATGTWMGFRYLRRQMARSGVGAGGPGRRRELEKLYAERRPGLGAAPSEPL
ncbi:MAG TPA: peptidase [Gammaproteobacteria bacterium]